MIPLVFLRSVGLFKDLSDEELTLVQKCCEQVNLGKENKVFEETDPAEYLYTLIEGQVSLRYQLPSNRESKNKDVASLGPGESFGWSSVNSSGKYTLSAYCTGDNCVAIRLDRAVLNELLEHNHTIGYKVMRNISGLIGERFIALQNKVARRDGQDDIDGW